MTALTEATVHSELERVRDLNKYYQPWLDSNRTKAVPVHDEAEKMSSVHASHDTTLTALAQLAALRLNVKRAMVSLINADVQIILAEATQTLSLVDETRHAPGDPIRLGSVSLSRKDCVEEHVFGAKWTNPNAHGQEQTLSALVINDVAKDDCFKDRADVLSDPGVRFYAGVPIITKQSYEIGVYAVSDTKPRPEGLSRDQVLFMQDVAKIVADHLERVKGALERERDAVFVRGISSFIEGLSALKHKNNDPIDEIDVSSVQGGSGIQATDPQHESPHGRSKKSEPDSSTEPQSKFSTDTTIEDHGDTIETLPRYTRETEKPSKATSDTSTDDVGQIFSRASKTIQEGIDAQGCVFLDASSGLFSGRTNSTPSRTQSVRPQPAVQDDLELDRDWDTDDDGGIKVLRATNGDDLEQDPLSRATSEDELEMMASVLGASLADGASETFPNSLLKRKNLRQSLLRYPFGKCFYLNHGEIAPSQPSIRHKT